MAQPWDAEQVVGAEPAAALVGGQFPELRGALADWPARPGTPVRLPELLRGLEWAVS